MIEEWRPIVGFEEYYEVSNFGRVRGITRFIKTKCRWGGNRFRVQKGKIIAGAIRWCGNNEKFGYKYVNISKDKIQYNIRIHRAVLEAFVGDPRGRHGNHIDFNCFNNKLSNLEWVTHKQNIQHSARAGRMSPGEKHGNSKLTERLVRKIRSEYRPFINGYRMLGKKYGVADETIRAVIKKRTWGHVK